METTRGQWLLRVMLVVFGLILVLLPFHAFISTWGGTAVGPMPIWKSWKELLLFGLIPFIVAYFFVRPDVFKQTWKGWLGKLVVAYILLHVAMAIISPASLEAVIAGLLMNLRFLAMLAIGLVLAASDDSWVIRVKGWLEPWLLSTMLFLAIIAIAQVTVLPKEFLESFGYRFADPAAQIDGTIAPYILVDSNEDALRAFATMRGPNTLGAFLILPLILAIMAVKREPRNVLAGLSLGLGIVALVATSSRSAWLGFLVALATLILLWIPAKKIWKSFVWWFVPLVCMGVILLGLAVSVPVIRLAVFHSSQGDISLTEGSIDKHFQATKEGIHDVLDHPFGQGVGTAGPASFYWPANPSIAENYFVQLAQEVGFQGLVLFLAINLVVVHRLGKLRRAMWPRLLLASWVGLTIVNFFLHGWADDPTSMIWWGLAGLFMLTDKDQVT